MRSRKIESTKAYMRSHVLELIPIIMADYEFDTLWRCSVADGHSVWFCGVWSGPGAHVMCVRHADIDAEAERCASPGAPDPASAVVAAARKLRTITKADKKRRSGRKS
jgi:hypothetical protein